MGATLVATLTLAGCTTPAVPWQSPDPGPAADRPPLAADLAGGIPVSLGGEGHWAIHGTLAFTATQTGITALDLTTGATTWQASFPDGSRAWDAQPTVGVSADGGTVHGLRTVEGSDGARLELLSVEASSGEISDTRLVGDSADQWLVDLPPRILAADASSLVLSDNPESGYQVGVVRLPSADLAWRDADQAIAADASVLTRSGSRDRLTGAPVWQAAFQLGPLVGRALDTAVVEDGDAGRVVWLDAATGRELASIAAESGTCVAAASVVACQGAGVTGYDLASGELLWSDPATAQAVTTYRDWVYLWRSEQRGDVLDGRTGEVSVTDGELPRIRFGNEAGVLVDRADGSVWVTVG